MSDIKLLNENSADFPCVERAMSDPNGLLAVGGDLTQDRLLQAYRSGIFPWYEENQPILWWSPDPRCVLHLDKFHVSKSLRRTLNKNRFDITFDQAFVQVINACAEQRKKNQGTWITPEIKLAYTEMYYSGFAHSVEIWCNQTLVGGLYGIAMGSIFFGESMFSKQTDASKVAMYYLIEKLGLLAFTLIDCQVYNPHLESLGAECIPRREFIRHLKQQISDPKISLWR